MVLKGWKPLRATLSRMPLHAEPVHCVGRELEVTQLTSRLTWAGRVTPIQAHGPPGIGKSTVVLTAMYDAAVIERFGDGRYFVRCDAATSRKALVDQIA